MANILNKYIVKLLSKAKNRFLHYRLVLLGIFGLLLIYDIFILRRISDYLFVFLTIFWILNIWTGIGKPKRTLLLASFCLILAFIWQFFNNNQGLENIISWFFVFLFIFFIQAIFAKEQHAKFA